jgi:hypothetical protein
MGEDVLPVQCAKDCRCGEFCITSIWSTPKSPFNHARSLRRVVDKCTGAVDSSQDEEEKD